MASAAPILALLSGITALFGLLGAYSGLLAPMTGFMLFAAGAILGGLSTVIVSLVALVTTRSGRDPLGRRKALIGSGAGIVLLLIVLGPATAGRDAPPINDITTDLENPPEFASASEVPAYAGRDMSYPPEFVPVVREHYGDLQPVDLDVPPARAYEAALATARSLGWEIVASDPDRRVFDARDESAIFRFVDDIAVRVEARGSGSRVDVRSKSRDGRSDLGANAARIRDFTRELAGELEKKRTG